MGLIQRVQAWFAASPEIDRSSDQQRQVDRTCQGLTLYQQPGCLYCLRVRRTIRRLALPIELRNTYHPEAHRQLIEGGGRSQVPCLRIRQADGTNHWLYESGDICRYLQQQFGAGRLQ